MDNFVYLGLVILGLFAIFDGKTVRIQWNSVASFCGFMVIVTLARISIESYARSKGLPDVDYSAILNRPSYFFFRVFWEDAVFVLPLVFLGKFRLTSKWWIWYPLILTSSVLFGLGHSYQGTAAIFITALYPFLLSYNFGRRYGFGTVMCCHIIYDFATFYTAKYGHFLY